LACRSYNIDFYPELDNAIRREIMNPRCSQDAGDYISWKRSLVFYGRFPFSAGQLGLFMVFGPNGLGPFGCHPHGSRDKFDGSYCCHVN
jgi:hypothetical protein